MKNRIREVIISLTNHCNLKCAMCQIPLNNVRELSTVELRELITDIADSCPDSIVFSGGEPLLRKDIFELISFANQLKINTCLASNGTLINDEVAGLLASSGLGVINISIEGPEQIHDSLRGEGNFKKAIAALEHLVHHKIETTIATVVCGKNYKFLTYVIELAHQLGVTTVKFQPFSEIFLIDKDGKNQFFASGADLRDIETEIKRVIEISRSYNIAVNPDTYLRSVAPYLCGCWQRKPHSACPGLFSSCSISAEGDVHICWVLYDTVLGNVRNKRLSEIWDSEGHNRLRETAIKEKCKGCLMSCYDYNFEKPKLKELFILKKNKLKKPRFYKRQYFRIYQYAHYIFKKIINRSINLRTPSENDTDTERMLCEIQMAKEILKKHLRD
jgi:MoaA/NifB/PqqE/SkfB family radical SAM enzyme